MIAYLILAPLVMASVMCVCAFLDRDTDARLIAEHKPIHHKSEAAEIMGIAVVVALVLTVAGVAWCRSSWWSMLPLAVLGFGVFTPLNRYLLNTIRDKPWWYMGPMLRTDKESAYDTFWMRAFCWPHTVTPKGLLFDDRTAPRKAAIDAYSFEITVAVAAIIGFVFLNT